MKAEVVGMLMMKDQAQPVDDEGLSPASLLFFLTKVQI